MADEILTALGQVARERRDRVHDPSVADDDEAARVLLRPLDADEHTLLLERVMNGLAAASESPTPAVSAAVSSAPPAATVEPTPGVADREPALAQVIPLAPRRRAWFAGLGSLAAAAVLLVWIASGDDFAGLPEYTLVRGGGDAVTRSGDTPSGPRITLRSDSAVDLVLAPQATTEGQIAVSLIAVRGDETLWLDPVGAEVSTDGAIRLRGARAWGLTPGPWTVTVVIARANQAPADLDAYRRGPARASDWQRVQLELEVVDAR